MEVYCAEWYTLVQKAQTVDSLLFANAMGNYDTQLMRKYLAGCSRWWGTSIHWKGALEWWQKSRVAECILQMQNAWRSRGVDLALWDHSCVLLILYFLEHSISTLLIKIVTNNHWFNHSHIIIQLKQIYKIIIEVREHYERGARLNFGTRMLTPA